MVPKRSGKTGPGLDLQHSFTEDEASHLISQLLYLIRIGGHSKAFCQSKKSLLFFLLSLKALLYEFDKHAIVAESPFLGDTLDLLSQFRRQGYASSNLFCGRHDIIIHRYGARTARPYQLTQSKNLYHAPANGKNQGVPLYKPSGAPGKGMPTNGFSGLSPAISSAIF